MTSNIRLNYEKVMREAARLDGEENVFEEQIKKICGVAERLRHEWESPASAVCIQKIEQIAGNRCKKFIREMTETRKKMQQTIELIELVATRIQHAEEETKRMAEQL